MPKVFCRDVVVLQDFLFIQKIFEFFTNTVHKASNLYLLCELLEAQIFALHGQKSHISDCHPTCIFSLDCDLAMAVEGREGNNHTCCLNDQIQETGKNMGLYPCGGWTDPLLF